MSLEDLKRIEVLTEVLSGRRTAGSAGAAVLTINEREAYRLLARYEAGGGAELIHKPRGQTSNRSVNIGIRHHSSPRFLVDGVALSCTNVFASTSGILDLKQPCEIVPGGADYANDRNSSTEGRTCVKQPCSASRTSEFNQLFNFLEPRQRRPGREPGKTDVKS